jgi:hypothetical protein
MKAIAEAVDQPEDEPTAIAYALAILRMRLGWESDSEARAAAVLARFAPVAQAVFAALKPNDDNGEADIAAALARFETWYAQTHTTPFWTLFEHDIPETPRVDF